MKLNKNLVLFALFHLYTQAFSQSEFHYKRNISGVEKEGWHKLILPPDIFQHVNPRLGDMRVFSVANGDTVQVPYLLNIREDQVKLEKVNLRLFNQSYRDGVLYLTFELDGSKKVNLLDLEFAESDYFGYITLQGSNDGRDWFEILKDHRIVSISKDGDQFKLSGISFPLSSYRFLRLAATSDVPLHFRSASFHYRNVQRGELRGIPLEWETQSDNKSKESLINIKLQHHVPVSAVRVQINNDKDYYRGFQLRYVSDSARTQRGWTKYYDHVISGHLTSFKTNAFQFPVIFTKELQIVIRDFDNQALEVQDISVESPQVDLVTHLRPGANFILYGSASMHAPVYDLTHFRNKIPSEVQLAVLQDEEDISVRPGQTDPLFENKLWLWCMMGLMIGGLGFFTIRMMKN